MISDSEIEAIAKRDAEASELWHTGPPSFTALAARDRRALLAAYRQVGAQNCADARRKHLRRLAFALVADGNGPHSEATITISGDVTAEYITVEISIEKLP